THEAISNAFWVEPSGLLNASVETKFRHKRMFRLLEHCDECAEWLPLHCEYIIEFIDRGQECFLCIGEHFQQGRFAGKVCKRNFAAGNEFRKEAIRTGGEIEEVDYRTSRLQDSL